MQLRRELAWVMIVFVGLYGLWLSAMGSIAYGYGYRPEAQSLLMFIRHTQPLFIVPCVLLALVPPWWAMVPLWLLSISICIFPYVLNVQQNGALEYVNAPFSVREVKEIALVMLVPIAMQIALLLKGTGNQRTDNF
jgi:hypothetical protein